MARGRNQPALFEVIQKGNKSKSSFAAPKWWFKGQRPVEPLDAGSTPAAPAAVVPPAYSPLAASSSNGVSATPPVPPAIRPSIPPVAVSLSGKIRTSTDGQTPRGQSSPPVVDVDGNRQEISLRLTFTTAVIVVFAILVCIALAVVAGRKLSSASPQPAQPGAQQVAGGTADPSVLGIGPGQKSGGGGGEPQLTNLPPGVTPPLDVPLSQAPGPLSPIPTPQGPAPKNPQQPVAPAGQIVRKAGLNYLVVQSYPEEADAKAVVEVLAKEGVTASVERKLRGFNASWYQVVTAEGYVGRSDPNYETMMSKLKSISEKTRATNRKFKALEPVMFKWAGQ